MPQPAPPKQILALELPCDPTAPRVVRDALHELDWLGWVLGDVTLVASELVANAVTHSGAKPDDTLQVRAELDEDRLRIAVHDPGRSGSIAHVRTGDPEEGGGWGLLIVEQLSQRWGAESNDGQVVWADVALPGTEAEPTLSRRVPAAQGSAPPGD
jgi:anti-sigma regulatory factor (Ser/Thr protein kinase)